MNTVPIAIGMTTPQIAATTSMNGTGKYCRNQQIFFDVLFYPSAHQNGKEGVKNTYGGKPSKHIMAYLSKSSLSGAGKGSRNKKSGIIVYKVAG
jgi:hypothetical protein